MLVCVGHLWSLGLKYVLKATEERNYPFFLSPVQETPEPRGLVGEHAVDSFLAGGYLHRPVMSRVQEAAHIKVYSNTKRFLLFSQSTIPVATMILHCNLRLAGLTDKSNTSRLIFDEGYAGIKDQASLRDIQEHDP
ncbi:uncharacterized protein Bfra_010492 [Botrytis fragariae]|uniref:Uncharacterized protein n=1 Tax=Botrytis fragariae TaxID=1964551 RepID=A0A8H6AEL8_9HELO|nr:uncharacterized protein Bfra_010492 [Botrytis fragariae]KAF5867518.1 hypothetical protein Bfra_010492 [Botrytis fragariae]